MLQAHPDHGGTPDALQQALRSLREDGARKQAAEARATPPTQRPTATVRSSLWGIGKSLFYVYFVLVPIGLGFGLLLARAYEWLT